MFILDILKFFTTYECYVLNKQFDFVGIIWFNWTRVYFARYIKIEKNTAESL